MKNTNLTLARKSKGLTQKQLANLMNCSKSTISNWENGYSVPHMKDAFKLAQVLEKELSFLFFKHYVQVSHTSFNE